ncbi:hypothetical protein LR48_Vigan11g090400 [Vigna angularis]|uniref:Uncharacterized protein n=1 Tax=Phaseolus angularis TaxID=3914 RepID=A0A0L9VS13_PHAAN|nr:hypothetical protein LR48_Vigan11g090400 [Vigna angularis]
MFLPTSPSPSLCSKQQLPHPSSDCHGCKEKLIITLLTVHARCSQQRGEAFHAQQRPACFQQQGRRHGSSCTVHHLHAVQLLSFTASSTRPTRPGKGAVQHLETAVGPGRENMARPWEKNTTCPVKLFNSCPVKLFNSCPTQISLLPLLGIRTKGCIPCVLPNLPPRPNRPPHHYPRSVSAPPLPRASHRATAPQLSWSSLSDTGKPGRHPLPRRASPLLLFSASHCYLNLGLKMGLEVVAMKEWVSM